MNIEQMDAIIDVNEQAYLECGGPPHSLADLRAFVHDSLDAAWAEAEAALPEPGYIVLGGPYPDGTWGASAFLNSQTKRMAFGFGFGYTAHAGAIADSGPAALRALAAKLRGE
jgi:hypothetical protein